MEEGQFVGNVETQWRDMGPLASKGFRSSALRYTRRVWLSDYYRAELGLAFQVNQTIVKVCIWIKLRNAGVLGGAMQNRCLSHGIYWSSCVALLNSSSVKNYVDGTVVMVGMATFASPPPPASEFSSARS